MEAFVHDSQLEVPEKPRTVAIYLKGPSALRRDARGKKFEPLVCRATQCRCGILLHFYTSLRKEKHVPFDREPRIVEGTQYTRADGAVIAEVLAEDVHFNSCPETPR